MQIEAAFFPMEKLIHFWGEFTRTVHWCIYAQESLLEINAVVGEKPIQEETVNLSLAGVTSDAPALIPPHSSLPSRPPFSYLLRL